MPESSTATAILRQVEAANPASGDVLRTLCGFWLDFVRAELTSTTRSQAADRRGDFLRAGVILVERLLVEQKDER